MSGDVKFLSSFDKKIIQQLPIIKATLGGAVSNVVTANHSTQARANSSSVSYGTIIDFPKNKCVLFDWTTRNMVMFDPGTGSREFFGRITYLAGVWTMSYFYRDDFGVEIAQALPGPQFYDYYYPQRNGIRKMDELFAVSPRWRSP